MCYIELFGHSVNSYVKTAHYATPELASTPQNSNTDQCPSSYGRTCLCVIECAPTKAEIASATAESAVRS